MTKYIAFLLVLLLPLTAKADWVMLNNGDRISGSIVSENSVELTIENNLMGQMSIPKSKIASSHKGSAPRVLARETRTGVQMSAINAPLTQKTAPAMVKPAPVKKAVSKKSEERKDGIYKWSGRVSAGGNIQDGNSNSKSITADADIKARDKKNRFGLGGEANWAEDEGEKTDNDQQIYANYDRFVTDKWFIGGRQSFEKDEFEELDLRSQTGLFAGYQFYEQDDLNLQIKAGPEYIYEKFENGDSESDLAAAWALDYDQKLLEDDTLQIFHKHEVAFPFVDTGAFLFESESGALVPIGERLDASAQVDFDWDNDPTDGVEEGDTTYALKLGYGW